jgi:hypothetical protein
MTFKAVFPDILARDRTGQGRPGASEAVSGCNILILRLDASVLRVIGPQSKLTIFRLEPACAALFTAIEGRDT